MGSLLLVLGHQERRLPEQDAHYLWTDGGGLRVSANPPSREVCFGYFVSEFGTWWFHSGPADSPREVRINGCPVTGIGDVELATGRAEVRLAAAPYSEPPPCGEPQRYEPGDPSGGGLPRSAAGASGSRHPGAVPRLVIGPIGSEADLQVDDPSVLPCHAYVEIDANGAWWVTADQGEVYVDGEPVTSARREPGTRFTVGARVVRVPGGTRKGRALPVDCAGVTARRGGTALIDNVSLSINAGDLVAVVGHNPASTQMLLGLIIGAYRCDRGTVLIGRSSRVGNPRVRWVPPADDLYADLTVRETLAFAAALGDSGLGYSGDRAGFLVEILSYVGLTELAGNRVRVLSGADRKRLAVGLELVMGPGLLVVFESSTGHEISRDRDLVSRLRTISRDLGCTVIIAACSAGNLDLADHVVVVNRNGRLRFAGPPGGRLANHPDLTWVEWLANLDVPGDESGLGRSIVPVRLPPLAPKTAPDNRGGGLPIAARRQLLLLARRGPAILAALAILPPLGALVAGLLADSPLPLIVVAVLSAAAVCQIDLVTQRPQLARDRRAGIGAATIVGAKLGILGGVCAGQAVGMVVVGAVAGTGAPLISRLSLPGSTVLLWLLMLMSLACGLAAGAAVPAPDTVGRGEALVVSRLTMAGVLALAVTAALSIVASGVLIGLGALPAFAGFGLLSALASVVAVAMLERRLNLTK